ncbi:hypothetical protein H0H81_006252 [Sphagnurus paluster]|uniref:Uncharacterized protein n=1 Tax=Sphagnurus paluster TaxID=117069 RepID=A0A9P7GMQ6_9AGAR|nr:hypothetical protein H0H81_006252 [Sphagnurus paluster]
MFRSAVRAARPVAIAARSALKPQASSPFRALHTTLRVSSGGPAPPQLYGEGGKPGQVPSDVEQATGLERLQLLGELEGVKVFDDSPLEATRIGTKANPVLVPSYDVERIVGCTGVPADSHDVLWFNVTQQRQARCSECGSVYALDVQSGPLEHSHLEHAEHSH